MNYWDWTRLTLMDHGPRRDYIRMILFLNAEELSELLKVMDANETLASLRQSIITEMETEGLEE